MTSEGLGEMFEGDSADMCAEKYPLVSMGGRAEGLACADPVARTPSALAEMLLIWLFPTQYYVTCNTLKSPPNHNFNVIFDPKGGSAPPPRYIKFPPPSFCCVFCPILSGLVSRLEHSQCVQTFHFQNWNWPENIRGNIVRLWTLKRLVWCSDRCCESFQS